MNGSRVPAGWLADQLPRVMAEDPFTRRFLGIFEEIAGGLRARVTGFEHDLDVGLAPPAFVRWMGGWLGLSLDPSLPEEHQRSLVRAAGRLFPLRGTRPGLQGLLEAFTRASVEVTDGGGVFREGASPANPRHVTIKLSDPGPLAESHLLDLIRGEIPADATFELRVGRRKVKDEVEPQEDLGATVQIAAVAPDADGGEPSGPEPGQAPPPPPPPPPPSPPKGAPGGGAPRS